jgi:hypothetical protein
VAAGTTQRRPGLHVEAPGTLLRPGSSYVSPDEIVRLVFLAFVLRTNNRRGEGARGRAGPRRRACSTWSPTSRGRAVCGTAASSSIVHLRCALNKLAHCSFLGAEEVWWITDATPHEAVAVKRECERTFVRVVTSDVPAWFADHSTPNPAVPLPESVTVVRGDKFEQLPPLSGHCRFCHAVLPEMVKCVVCGLLYCTPSHMQLDKTCPGKTK